MLTNKVNIYNKIPRDYLLMILLRFEYDYSEQYPLPSGYILDT